MCRIFLRRSYISVYQIDTLENMQKFFRVSSPLLLHERPLSDGAGYGGLLPGVLFVLQIQGFNFISGPGGPSQKMQAGFDARVIRKTSDADDPSQFLPAMNFYQPGQDHFQRDAVKWIVRLAFGHDISHSRPFGIDSSISQRSYAAGISLSSSDILAVSAGSLLPSCL